VGNDFAPLSSLEFVYPLIVFLTNVEGFCMIEDGHAFISIRRKVTLLQHRDDSQQQFLGSGKWTA
jgi:hypothetical protein